MLSQIVTNVEILKSSEASLTFIYITGPKTRPTDGSSVITRTESQYTESSGGGSDLLSSRDNDLDDALDDDFDEDEEAEREALAADSVTPKSKKPQESVQQGQGQQPRPNANTNTRTNEISPQNGTQEVQSDPALKNGQPLGNGSPGPSRPVNPVVYE